MRIILAVVLSGFFLSSSAMAVTFPITGFGVAFGSDEETYHEAMDNCTGEVEEKLEGAYNACDILGGVPTEDPVYNGECDCQYDSMQVKWTCEWEMEVICDIMEP